MGAATSLGPRDSTNPPSTPLQDLLALLDLDQIEVNVFRGFIPPENPMPRVFGGQVAAQALVAASRTVAEEGRLAHSLHAYFLRPGDPNRPIVYEVDRIRDGRSYTTRRVVGIQAGKAIFNLQASFQVHEDGYEHQLPAPAEVPGPEGLEDFHRWAGFGGDRPIEVRLVPVESRFRRFLWLRANGELPDAPALHRHVATYASDMTLLSVILQPHAVARLDRGFAASLDHAVWFHREFRMDEWLLWDQETSAAAGGRGLAEGRMFTTDGRLVMSMVQEGAVRPPSGAGV
ncbi:MAG: acyl-CoA thioesterase [Acidimicrobiales bacterium]